MIPMELGEIARLLVAKPSGRCDLAATVTAATADSRAVRAGTLFVALAGERVDGHDFVPAAIEAGAVAALTDRPAGSSPCLIVPDALAAFGRLARAQIGRAQSDPDGGPGLRVVGVTGSQGKTSTKDLLAQILERAAPTVAPEGNLNNELGLPLTVLRIDEQTRFLVAEMGARGVGHIAYLCQLAPPSVGVVLNVGHAHVGEFGSQAAIAQAKGELVEALPVDGVAVLNATDPLVWEMRARTAARVWGFAVDAPLTGVGAWASDLVSDASGRYGFTLHHRAEDESEAEVEVQLRLLGRHHVANAAAAATAALALGLPLPEVAAALSEAGPRSRWRMELHDRADGVTVINDSYNANPDSMHAAVDTLAELGRSGRRTWAVLGDMLELGNAAAAAHRDLGGYVAEHGIDQLVAVGSQAGLIVAGARDGGMGDRVRAPGDKQEAARLVIAELQPGDVVLVKASRGLALNTVADEILDAGGPLSQEEPTR